MVLIFGTLPGNPEVVLIFGVVLILGPVLNFRAGVHPKAPGISLANQKKAYEDRYCACNYGFSGVLWAVWGVHLGTVHRCLAASSRRSADAAQHHPFHQQGSWYHRDVVPHRACHGGAQHASPVRSTSPHSV